MAVKIKPLRKFSTGTPSTSDMEEGEIAVNTADKKVFMRDDSNNIVEVGAASSLSLPIGGGTITGALNVDGNATLGNATTDDHIINGTLKIVSTTNEQNFELKTTFGSETSNTPDLGIYNNSTQSGDDNKLGLIQFFSDTANYTKHQFADVIGMAFQTGNAATEGGITFRFANGASQSWGANKEMSFRPEKIQYYNGTSTTTLAYTTPTSGDVTITLPNTTGTVALTASPTFTGTVSTPVLRITDTTDASLSSTGHGLQIGSTSGLNVIIDNNEIMARNNSANSTLTLQNDGGSTSIGGQLYFGGTTQEICYEGSTADGNETFIRAIDATGDRVINFPDASGTVALTASPTFTDGITITDASDGSTSHTELKLEQTTTSPALYDYGPKITFYHENNANESIEYSSIRSRNLGFTDGSEEGRFEIWLKDSGTDTLCYGWDNNLLQIANKQPIYWYNFTSTYDGTLTPATMSASRTWTLPDTSGTVHTTANTEITGAYGSTSAPRIFKVTVATQTAAHPYNGDGSTSKYVIDGIMGAALTLHGADTGTSNSQYYYRFDQSDSTNNGHPLRFYLDAAKNTAYTFGVTTNGTPGQAGAYTQIAVTQDTPQILYYQCSQHGYMGNYVIVPHSTNIKHSTGNISLTAAAGNISLTQDTGNMVFTNTGTNADITFATNGTGVMKHNTNTVLTVGNSDAPTTTTSDGDADFVLVDDGGTMKKITPANLGIGGAVSSAADNISTGDAAVNLATSSGNITVDAQQNNSEIIFKGTVANNDVEYARFTNASSNPIFELDDGVSLRMSNGAKNKFNTLTFSNPTSDSTITIPNSTGTLIHTGNSNTPTTTTSSSDADFVIIDDGGTMKKITPAHLGIGGGGSGSGVTVQDEGSSLSTTGTVLNFVGAGVTASGTGVAKTITIPAGTGVSQEEAIAFAIVYG